MLAPLRWALIWVAVGGGVGYQAWPPPPPALYGNVVLNRTSVAHDQKVVVFPHWPHRMRFTCRVCHFELGFAMRSNATGITEARIRAGELCGACHDGETAFAHGEATCSRCHSGDLLTAVERFPELAELPGARSGNQVDWCEAVRVGAIEPRQSLGEEEYAPLPFGRVLRLEATWNMVSPAYFPHDEHQRWLDCGQCHPSVFNIEKKATKGFEMRMVFEGRYCGACHHHVAFPLDDCRRCHSRRKR